jgi:penicillin-binding protein 2
VSVIHAPKERELDPRLLTFPVVMGLLLATLFARLWYLQVVKATELQERASQTSEAQTISLAPRGLIFDRDGRLIAGVRPKVVVKVVPSEIEKNPALLDRLAAVLNADKKKLLRKMNENRANRNLPTVVFVGADLSASGRIAEAPEEFPGVEIDTLPMRYYRDGTSFSHVLGYVWTPDPRDEERFRERGFTGTIPAYVGKQGIEKAYETDLMGTAGVQWTEIDAKGRPLRVVERDAAVPGGQLYLSLDADLQKAATHLLGAGGYKASAVALDPSTGEILCMVSSPTFDQTIFEGGITQSEWDSLNSEERTPMLNRAIQTALAPGSTFKIVTAIAAARAGKWDPNRPTFCDGGFHMGRKTFKCLGHHGSITFERAMEKSCNTYFCALGKYVGRESLVETSEMMGLGEKSGLEIGGEQPGDLPNDRWLNRARKPAVWYGGDVVNAAIGQGAVAATPLQMANVAAMVGTRGIAYVPHLVHAVRTADGTVQKVIPRESHRIELPDSFWEALTESLGRVVESGTAQRAKIQGVAWGGKTGSAEHAKGTVTHSWFVGMAPLVNPKIAICVRVESSGHGGDVAAPIARDLVKIYLDKMARKAAASSAAVSPSAALPSAR